MAASRPPLRILVAADKFKGTLSGPEACAAIAGGLRDALGDSVELHLCPVADGGEGMARGITEARQGEWMTATVADPLERPVRAGYGIINGPAAESVAVIEMAEASGLWRVAENERDPWRASTRGTGELIRAAIDQGADRILLGIGGSATNDGGTGLAAALGFRFLDSAGAEISDLPERLGEAATILFPDTEPPPVEVACDVTNPLLGPEGCTRVYGPQKGVSDAEIPRHEARLAHLVSLLGDVGEIAARVPGSGAAGGLGFGCLAFLTASLRPGFPLVAETLGLENAIAGVDLVITGEGRLDHQTLQGKAPAGVAALARKLGKPVAAFAGVIEADAAEVLGERFDYHTAIEADGMSGEESLRHAATLLRETARRHADSLASLVTDR